MPRGPWFRVAAFCGVAALLAALAWGRPEMSMAALLQALAAWLAAHPHVGLLAYSGLFVALFMAFVPTTPMELLAGYAFGFWPAFGVLCILKPLSYGVTFVTMRQLGLRDAGSALKGRVRAFRAVGLAIEADKDAARRIVFLVCLAYLPAAAKVCGLAAVPSVRVGLVVACSAIAGIPYSLASAWLGSSADDLQELLQGNAPMDSWTRGVRLGALILGSGGLVGCLAAIGWYGKVALDGLVELDKGLLEDEEPKLPQESAEGPTRALC